MAKHSASRRTRKGPISLSGIFGRKRNPQASTLNNQDSTQRLTGKTQPSKWLYKEKAVAPKSLNEGRPKLPTGQDTVHRLSRSLERTKDVIVADALDSLYKAEQLLTSQLRDANTAALEKIEYLGLSSGALAPFQLSGLKSRSKPMRKRSLLRENSAKRLGELRQKLKTIEHALEQHWQEWTMVQNKILCLGAEILGPRSQDLVSDDMQKLLKRKYTQAIENHEKRAAGEKELQEVMAQQRESITSISKDTLQELATQEKVRQFVMA
ncbi:predicted protein [Uncinocarpus reesii 1704]|uniref:Uncharacterized protein n=1 Tax=Uncinocarpus reesii (strain UAMH 1704) TaxID=336963 RepID=C4JT70_UNCRE|nr:uncharacterized protein UREG_05659 [Uncinocarpus reesii 1704]EEP80817.1 predicted protein [Uncinocarpus reesii 1704]